VGVPVDHPGWINNLPIRSDTDISRSMVLSPRPAAATLACHPGLPPWPATLTCHSNPSRPGAISDIDQPSHHMLKSMSDFPAAQTCPGRAIHDIDING
jgi:hypothetical protein